jgi:hypothetical protein
MNDGAMALSSVERERVLELGSVPLPVVTARFDRFIAGNGKGRYPGYGVSRSRLLGSADWGPVAFGGSPNALLRSQNVSIVSGLRCIAGIALVENFADAREHG